MFRGLIVLFAAISVTMAAVAIRPLDEKPEEFKHIPGCFIRELHAVIAVGTTEPSLDECKGFTCTEYNVQILTCGAISVRPPYVEQSDPSQKYPDCCPRGVLPPSNPPEDC